MKFIDENYTVSGSDYDSFKNAVKALDDATSVKEVPNGAAICFLSLCKLDKAQRDGKMSFFILNPDNLKDYAAGHAMKIGTVDESVVGPYIKDIEEGSGLMVVIDNDKYIVSKRALTTIGRQAGTHGDNMIQRNNIFRDMDMVDSLSSKNTPLRIVTRKDIVENNDGDTIEVRKMFAMLGKAMFAIPQERLVEVIDALNNLCFDDIDLEVVDWSIDQDFTIVTALFDTNAASIYNNIDAVIKPGIELITSDVGKSAICAKLVYNINGVKVFAKQSACKHTKSGATLNAIMSQIAPMFDEATIMAFPKAVSMLKGKSFTYKDMDEMLRKLLGDILPVKHLIRCKEELNISDDNLSKMDAYELYLQLINVINIITSAKKCDKNEKTLDYQTVFYVRDKLAQIPYLLLK